MSSERRTLAQLGFTPLNVSYLPEEQRETAIKIRPSRPSPPYRISLRMRPGEANEDVFFVDGVQRSAGIGVCRLPNAINVPVIASHIVVGAIRLSGSDLIPQEDTFHQLIVVFYPHGAILEYLGRPDEIEIPQPSLDYRGNFFRTARELKSSGRFPLTFCDTTYTFREEEEGAQHRIENPNELAASARVISHARSALDSVRRVLEIGVVAYLRRNYPKSLVVYDGPLVRRNFMMYVGRLIDEDLKDLNTGGYPSARSETFDFYRRIIGIVKSVRILPEEGVGDIYQIGQSFNVAACHLQVELQQQYFERVLSCFICLRPELAQALSIGPYTSMLARVDIPLPALIGECDLNWTNPDYEVDISNYEVRSRLESILNLVMSLRYPTPPTSNINERFTKLYPIFELELMLKSLLLPDNELAPRVLSGLYELGYL